MLDNDYGRRAGRGSIGCKCKLVLAYNILYIIIFLEQIIFKQDCYNK